jgi:hypothetical protein
MNFTRIKRSLLGVALLGGFAATALPQIPLPPLPPGLNVRITTGRPPAIRREVRVARPGPDYVWVGGFWDDNGGHWDWVPGRWERPAQPRGYWIAPRYVRSGRGTIYEPGHWSGQQVVVEDNVRQRSEWRRHEREHRREEDRERRQDHRDDHRDDHRN